MDWSIYTLVDPVFFETPARSAAAEHLVPPRFAPLPDGWRHRAARVWDMYQPELPGAADQGWKIHVSATYDNAERVLEIVAEHCLRARVPFKHLRSRSLLNAMNSKYAPRPAGGKFIAVYPRDEAEFAHCARELDERLAGSDGPYILTDCRWGEGPVHFRYGAFRERWCWTDDGALVLALTDADGRLVPDRRRPAFTLPEGVPVPDVLRPHIERRTAPSGDFGYRVKEALHFSNAGGVYAAVRRDDGSPVVLKEARPHTGRDGAGLDATARLAHEKHVLDRLADVPGVPRAYELFDFGGHSMLAMEHLDGIPLQRWMVRHHPLVNWSACTPEGLRDYAGRAEALHAEVAALVRRVHAEGIVFGDLHPGNVLVAEDAFGPGAEVATGRPAAPGTEGPPDEAAASDVAAPKVRLVDFEMAFPASEDTRPTLGYPGFAARRKTGPAVDEHALAVLRLWLFLPLVTSLGICPENGARLAAVAARRFGLPEDFTTTVAAALAEAPEARPQQAGERPQQAEHPGGQADPPGPPKRSTVPPPVAALPDVPLDTAPVDWAAVRASMARALHTSATPDRDDRLFPGDPRQFNEAPGGFAHGAAGVLWALSVAGGEREPVYEDWLLRAARADHVRPGFHDGAHGVAHVLDHLGHHAAAHELIDRVRPGVEEMTDVSLYGGLAGVGLNLLHLAGGDPGHAWLKEARELAARAVGALDDGRPHGIDRARGEPGTHGGLLHGWSGVGLFLLRMYEATGEDAYVRHAVRAVHRDLDLCVARKEGVLHVDGGFRSLPYLETGSVGIGLVADLLADHADDARVTEALPALALAARSPLTVESQLFNGRAGLLAAAHTLRGHLPVAAGPEGGQAIAGPEGEQAAVDPVAEHLGSLHWHALAHHGHVAFPGHSGLRLSMDLATGTAGVLTALSYVTDGGPPPLPFLHRAGHPPPAADHGLPAADRRRFPCEQSVGGDTA
ncbi:class III lanthionine synthetase LanKC N-terminal domain-containing protein [Streptomyces flavofungini]|uniref:Protein kinase/lanthionine synthetase C family protein n=1 Tax=Streptomyces flavofungini TaxID=68200 RepID=A0ABS0XHY1_9ACTN|nr:protein kinase/lanthionine synthetase C family protein [Streptomyces flavofungini]MBJ3812814.1 protein kinase/lanthionine synthetase C family protein [Streptomyces flavofungini]